MLLAVLLAQGADSIPLIDFRSINAAAERYVTCSVNAAGPMLKSNMSAEAIAEDAMHQCSKDADFLLVETRRTLESAAPPRVELDAAGQVELDAAIARASRKEKDIIRSNIVSWIKKARS
jgi:hypothetical protein